MAARKIGTTWWVDFAYDGIRYRKRSPMNSRAGALAFETTLRLKLARGEPIGPQILAADANFARFAWRWFDEWVVPNNKPSEQRRKKYALSASLVPFFGTMSVAQITTNDVERYKAYVLKTGVANKTVNNLLSVFRQCLGTAYEWLALAGAPPTVKWLKCPMPKTDYLAPDECALLLAHADDVVYTMILTALRTGMRQGELKGLQWSSINWQSGSITVRHSRCDYTNMLGTPKNGRERHIPMEAGLHRTLFDRRQDAGYVFLDADGMPFNHKRLTRRLAHVCKKAGLRRIGWHTLRHTFASELVMKGVPLPAVQALMGHSTIAMTMRYTHLAPTTLRAAVDLLSPEQTQDSNLRQPAVNRWSASQAGHLAQNILSSERSYVS
jgi:integrase